MLGAIVGDIIGSTYERYSTKNYDFDLRKPMSKPTDDTVLTCAVADAMMNGLDYALTIKNYARQYPLAGYGGRFISWVDGTSLKGYDSFGNGSAMRVSPVGWLCNSGEIVLEQAKAIAEVTHNHPEGIKGAQAVALAIYLSRIGSTKQNIMEQIESKFGYDLQRDLSEVQESYTFDATCQGSVPESIMCFLESYSYEDAIRLAISMGGDADTMAAIAGSIAEAFYKGVPYELVQHAMTVMGKDEYEMLLNPLHQFLDIKRRHPQFMYLG